MGSQTLDIFRQGVWASLTGGWFYDPHQNVFCNAVHLYIWLFLVCGPFFTYLYFPKTFATWSAYCLITTFTMAILKVVNMTLHVLYDRSHTISELNAKSSYKTTEKQGGSECGIEMQVLGLESNLADQRSAANSVISVECQDNTSKIDLKVDVHRKNSSESNESVPVFVPEVYKNSHKHSYARGNSLNTNYGIGLRNAIVPQQENENDFIPNENKNEVTETIVHKEREAKMKTGLNRQTSFDITDVDTMLSKNSYVENEQDARKTINFKLQRHRSSESTDYNLKRNRQNFHNYFENQSVCINRNNLQNLVSTMYLEANYTKSDLGIENIEYNANKLYSLGESVSMRKDTNSTMSALQLPITASNCSNTRKRRHSNTGNKLSNTTLSSVRRIKSAALEISCAQPSVSNLSPHPNSAETISGQQIKNPESAILPPPSKCLIRNPHLNLCPRIESFGGICSGMIDSVYPIVEQADERSINNVRLFIPDPYIEYDTNEENITKFNLLRNNRCSTTRSESEMERARTQSTDSETDNNGSSSPLLNKIPKEKSNDMLHKSICLSTNKSGDSGFPSSDCKQASASSKDLLLTTNSRSKNLNIAMNYNYKQNCASNHVGDCCEDKIQADSTLQSVTKEPKSLGAIPKISMRSEELYIPMEEFKRNIQKSPSENSSSGSSRSCSIEHFSNEITRSHKDQWHMIGNSKQNHTAQNELPINFEHDDVILNTCQKRAMDGCFKLQPILTRSAVIKRRHKERDDKVPKDEGDISTAFEFSNDDDSRNARNATLSIQDFMHEQYSFASSISCEQRPSAGTILNIGRVEFTDSVYCDYWRPCSLSTEKHAQPKRFYNYRLKFFGRRELRIVMDRLELLALFDRDLDYIHVVFAILLSSIVCLLGSIILHMGIYKDVFAFIFCIVIAGSQYSLLKSVQPDAASPVHGFNKTVAYSRPIYFCLCSCLLLLSRHLSKGVPTNEFWKYQKKNYIFGMPVVLKTVLDLFTNTLSVILVIFPILFSLGLFPQVNTFCMYILEQIDMHFFGGSATCSLQAAILCLFKSILAVCILYGPIYGAFLEEKGTQHILFSIFCALLVPISYHLSRSASDFSHVWALIKSNMASYSDEDEEEFNKSNTEICKLNLEDTKNKDLTSKNIDNIVIRESIKSYSENINITVENEYSDPLPKKLQSTVNSRLKNDIVVSITLAVFILVLHSSTVFTVLQPELNTVLFSIAGTLGFFLHYIIPQMRKHLPWLCFARPILKQEEYGRFEVGETSKLMWFEKLYVYLCFVEKNVLYPLIFVSALTADSQIIVKKYGISLGSVIIAVCSLKSVRSAYSDSRNQYLILIFCVLLFKFDLSFASETFLLDYFVISYLYRKCCEFLLKMQFIVTYIAPWQITWGSAFHAFAQPFSVPHSAMLFVQAAISSVLSTPLNPFLGSAIFLTSYVRPIKFWERDYNTKRIDHSNTRLSSQLERDLGADDNNLNSIFYEHLTRSLQHSLCGDLMLGRWGNVNQGDCFVLASDYLNCLVHIIELGNGLCTFQMRGLEFRGTYCQQREVEAISEGIEDNDGCCCCAPGHIPRMLSANAMFSTRWLAWQVVAAQYVLEGYSISENLATATLQLFEFRKVLITYYMKSIIFYVTQNPKLNEWLAPGPIREALDITLKRQFVDLDPIFNYNLDEDFDFRALGITRGSFCYVYLNWIQFCYARRNEENIINVKEKKECDCDASNDADCTDSNKSIHKTESPNEKSLKNHCSKLEKHNRSIITKDSQLVSLCLALGLLARRSLATASHSSLSGVDFFLHGLHALFKGDFRITSPRDEWVFADMELLHGVVAPAVKMGLKLHQDHFSSPDEYLDPVVLYDAISSHNKDLVISHEADPIWRNAVLRGAPNLLALRHVMEDGSDEYRIIRLTKRFLSFRVIKLNRECVRGLWAGQQQELIYLRNRNPERGSIQNAKQVLRNIINSSCDQPIGYPIYVSPLTTSYAESNEQLSRIIGGSITLDAIQNLLLHFWKQVRERCREGCSSGSRGMDCDPSNELPVSYFTPTSINSGLTGTAATFAYGSQNLPGSSVRTSFANMTKPTNSALFVGFLNRERDPDRESIRDRFNKKNLQLRVDRERRATLPITTATNKQLSDLKDTSSSTNSYVKELSYSETSKAVSNSTNNLAGTKIKMSFEILEDNIDQNEFNLTDHLLIDLNKKVIIVDVMEIYDCLDLGRRIDVIWPNEKMRSNGGRSAWKEWSPKEGMVGFVVHYWQPNHPDQRFRSNVNRTLYLVEIGDHFVPVGEGGIREYKQIGFDFSITNSVITPRNIKINPGLFKNVTTSSIHTPTSNCEDK